MKTLNELEAERLAWSLETFPEATPSSSLIKLVGEIWEVDSDLLTGKDPTEEYADCLMCLFDSAGRAGISVEDITRAFEKKLQKNKARVWKRNDDNTYSHVKTADTNP